MKYIFKLNKDNKTVLIGFAFLFILMFLSMIFCIWILIGILFIISFIYYKKKNDKGALVLVGFLFAFTFYENLLKPLFQPHNPIITEIAIELNIENDDEIQDFYANKAYRTTWIGKDSNVIYASAEKTIQIPCIDTERYDKFLINGGHIKQLKSRQIIPRKVFDETYRVSESIQNDAPDETFGYR